MKVNIVCMRWGPRYGSHYVNLLFRGMERHLSLPFNFWCFTDSAQGLDSGIQVRDLRELVVHDSMKNTVYTKYTVMHSCIGLQGPTMFCDIDMMVMNSMDDFFTWNPGRFSIIWNWIAWRKTIFRPRPAIGNSSLFRFDAGDGRYNHVLERYLEDPQHVRDAFDTEQSFLSDCVRDEMQYWPSDWVQSFKFNCCWPIPLNHVFKPDVKAETRVLVFHGRPDPHEGIYGFQGGFRKKTLPLPELAEHWDLEAGKQPRTGRKVA